jgi:hypothetical protein
MISAGTDHASLGLRKDLWLSTTNKRRRVPILISFGMREVETTMEIPNNDELMISS